MAQLTNESMNSSTCNHDVLFDVHAIEEGGGSRAGGGQGGRGSAKLGGGGGAGGEGASTCSCLLGCYLLWLRLERKL